jgi:hypothetical protein
MGAINIGAKDGYWPLIKPVKQSDEIGQKIMVMQSENGAIELSADFRNGFPSKDMTFWYNPYQSPFPFAAYLIPSNLKKGSRVFIPDLIEDLVGRGWNQGDAYRKTSAYAIWNGADLEIEESEPQEVVG